MRSPALMAFSAIFLASAVTAQSDSTSAKHTGPGVYTVEQAERGKATHAMNCTSCHGTEAYTGDSFVKAWGGRTAFDFFDQLRTTMPNDNPGALKREEYIDVIAYIFSLNGLPSGPQELKADDDLLKTIKIDSIPSAPKQP